MKNRAIKLVAIGIALHLVATVAGCGGAGSLSDKEKDALKKQGNKALEDISDANEKAEIERILLKILKEDFDYKSAISNKSAIQMEFGRNFKTADECRENLSERLHQGVYASGILSQKGEAVATGPVKKEGDGGPKAANPIGEKDGAPAGKEKGPGGKGEAGGDQMDKHVAELKKAVTKYDKEIAKHFSKVSISTFQQCVEKMPEASKEVVDKICTTKSKDDVNELKGRSLAKYSGDKKEQGDCSKAIDSYLEKIVKLAFGGDEDGEGKGEESAPAPGKKEGKAPGKDGKAPGKGKP